MRSQVFLLFVLAAACATDADVTAPALPSPKGPNIENGWDPASGRGVIRVRDRSGGSVEIQLQNGYEGYAGGLVLGGHGSSGYRVHRGGAAKAGEPLALWCAQDESIWLESTGQELSYGWSENFGRGGDGVSLRYLGGAVVEQASDRLVLGSTNGAMPFRIDRWLSVDRDGALLFRVRVTNAGEATATFDFWTGDDPWVGAYGTARGDVGWTAAGLVENERRVDLLPGDCLGIADVDDRARRGAVRLANAFCLSPGSPAPSAAYFANGFAHSDEDIDPTRPLTGDSPTGFNVGWRDVTLGVGDRFEVGYMMGRAVIDAATGAISAPRIPTSSWGALMRLEPTWTVDADALRDPLRFAAERVELEVLPGGGEVEIRGRYDFENRGSMPISKRIFFPFAVDDAHLFPSRISVSSGRHSRLRDGIVFRIDVAANATAAVDIAYRQRCLDRSATYIVTSARAWAEPLDRARLVVVYPSTLPGLDVSYDLGPPKVQGESLVRETVIERFWPDRELTVRW